MPAWFRTAKKPRKPRLGKPLTRRLRPETLEARNMLAAVIVDDGGAGFTASLPTLTIDDGSPGYSEAGTWYTSGLGGVDGDSRWANAGATATYNFGSFTPGTYELRVNTPGHATSTTAAKYTITAGGTTTTQTIDQVPGTSGWLSLGTFAATGGTISVTVSTEASGAVRADAMQIVPTGGWVTSGLGGYDGDSLWAYQGSASYTFTGLTPGVNDIAVQVPQHYTSTTAALYTITSGIYSYTTTLNQRTSGSGWVSLGSYNLDSTATVTVSFASPPSLGDALRADAIRISRPVINVFATDSTINEAGETSTTFVFTRDTLVGSPIVGYQLSGAILGSDYTGPLATTGTITFASNSLEAHLTVTAKQDSDAIDEVIMLDLAGGDYEVGSSSFASVTIVDEDNAPEFDDGTFEASEELDSFTFELNQEDELGSAVGTITAHDLDENDIIEYSIESGNDDGVFAIDTFSGEVMLAVQAEDVSELTYSLVVKATDPSGLSDTATVTINVNVEQLVIVLNMDQLYPDLNWPLDIGDAVTRFQLTGSDLQAMLEARTSRINGALANPTVPDTEDDYYTFLARVETAELRQGFMANVLGEYQELIGSQATTREQFLEQANHVVSTYDLYLYDLAKMLKTQAQFMRAQWYISSADQALIARANALPLLFDEPSVIIAPEQIEWMEGGFREIATAVEHRIEWLDNVESTIYAIEGALVGVAVTALTAGAGTWLIGAVAAATGTSSTTVGAIALVGCFAVAAQQRASDGQAGQQVLLGAVADISGYTSVTTALWQYDPVAEQEVPMTPFWRGFSGVTGAAQLFVAAKAVSGGIERTIQMAVTPPPSSGGMPQLAFAGGPGVTSSVAVQANVVAVASGRIGLVPVNVYMTSNGAGNADPPEDTPSSILPELPEARENQMPLLLQQELDDAIAVNVSPAAPGTAKFDQFINGDSRILWAIDTNGQLRILPRTVQGTELKHSVLFEGAPVRAAGEANIAGTSGNYVGLDIDNQSGHYLPPESSLEYARYVFQQFGIIFP